MMAAPPTIDQWNPENGITLNEDEKERERQNDEETLAKQVRFLVT